MANYWILKSEPETYSFADLQKDGRTVWDGVRNPQALGNLRAMQQGDQAFFYHTGGEKALIGIARIDSAAYADPAGNDPKLAVVDLVPDRPLRRPVTLAEIKADTRFAALGLVRLPRLSVVPVPGDQWKALLTLAEG